MISASIWLMWLLQKLNKTLEVLAQVGSSVRSTQPTRDDGVPTARPDTGSGRSPALATSNLVSPLRQSIKAHTHAQIHTHTQSAAAQDLDCPDIYANPAGGKGKS